MKSRAPLILSCLLAVSCGENSKTQEDRPFDAYDQSLQRDLIEQDIEAQISYVIPKGWEYTKSENKARGSTARIAQTEEVPAGKAVLSDTDTASLLIREDSEYGLEAFVVKNGLTFMCREKDHNRVSISFDDEVEESWRCSGATGPSNAVFISNAGLFLRKIKRAQVVRIRAKTAERGDVSFKFDVRGLNWQ